MMNHCKDFLIFQEFQKFSMKEFLELLIEMKIKVIASGNSLLLTIREIDVSLMIPEVIFLIDPEIVILEI